MRGKHTHRGLSWIDLDSPTQEEVRKVSEEYHLNPLVAHELATPTPRAKVDLYDDYIYLVLHFPRARRTETNERPDLEIDFVIGKKFIISVRHGHSESLHVFGKLFDVNATLDKGRVGPHAGFIFTKMLRSLYEALHHELAATGESLGEIERRIFRGEEREMVKSLSRTSRDLLQFKRSLALHHEVLESFKIAGCKLFGNDFTFQLRALIDDYYRIESAVESNREFLSELRATNNSLLSTKQSEIMKTLTILAFIALPAMTVLSLFQIDSVSRPIVGNRFDFWILVLLLIAIALSLYSWFKHKQWL